MDDDYYAVLGVEPDVDHRSLRAAYLERMRRHHPDHRPGDAGDVARRLNSAYEVLRDPARRASYDRIRRARTARRGPHVPSGNGSGARPPRAPVTRTVENPAYSAAHRSYYHMVTRRLVRIGGAVFVVGLLVLLTLSV